MICLANVSPLLRIVYSKSYSDWIREVRLATAPVQNHPREFLPVIEPNDIATQGAWPIMPCSMVLSIMVLEG